MGSFDGSDDEENWLPRQRPRTIGLKRALARERQEEAELVENLTPSEMFSIDFSGDRESWLERENLNLEGLLEKAKRDTDIQRNMARHYAMRNMIARAKLKRAHTNIRALTESKEK